MQRSLLTLNIIMQIIVYIYFNFLVLFSLFLFVQAHGNQSIICVSCIPIPMVLLGLLSRFLFLFPYSAILLSLYGFIFFINHKNFSSAHFSNICTSNINCSMYLFTNLLSGSCWLCVRVCLMRRKCRTNAALAIVMNRIFHIVRTLKLHVVL